MKTTMLGKSIASLTVIHLAQSQNTNPLIRKTLNTNVTNTHGNISAHTNCTALLTQLGLIELDLRCELNLVSQNCSQLNLRNISVITQAPASDNCNISIHAANDDQCVSLSNGETITFDAQHFFQQVCSSQTEVSSRLSNHNGNDNTDDRFTLSDEEIAANQAAAKAKQVSSEKTAATKNARLHKRYLFLGTLGTVGFFCLLVACAICNDCSRH